MEKSENESIEDELLKQANIAFQFMMDSRSSLAASFLEKWFRPKLALALLDVQIREAERCDAYGQIGSPRVLELKAQRNKLVFKVAQLDEEKRGRK